jgi:septal ring factor EnvC (AmiA/AmiB activator)
MKTMKLVARIQKLLRRPPEETPLKKLRKTIKALKEKQRELEGKLKHTHGQRERQRLQQKIDVLNAQRRKGAEVYRQLKANPEGPPPAAVLD